MKHHVCMYVCMYVCKDRSRPVFYRTLFPSGRCPKKEKKRGQMIVYSIPQKIPQNKQKIDLNAETSDLTSSMYLEVLLRVEWAKLKLGESVKSPKASPMPTLNFIELITWSNFWNTSTLENWYPPGTDSAPVIWSGKSYSTYHQTSQQRKKTRSDIRPIMAILVSGWGL